MTPRDEPPRDPWLSEALRHAPDAGAQPPAELSATILCQARNAVKATPARTPANPLMQLWSWLARPPIAAGFATLMVATLVGVMWWDQPLNDTLPRPEAPAAAVPAPAAEPATALTPQAAPARDAAEPARPAEKEAPRVAAKRAAPQPPEPKREREQTTDARERAANAVAPAPAPANATTAASPPEAVTENAAKTAPAPARDRVADSLAAPAPAPAPVPAPALALAPAPAQALGKLAAAPAAGHALRRQEADTPTPLAEPAERWTWQRGTRPQAMTPALQHWLAQLDRTARWRAADAVPPPAADDDVLQLWRDGAPHSTIQLGADAVWLQPASGPPLVAPLPRATATALKAALLDATP